MHQVDATIILLDAANTIPFLARYRKEATGGLDEVQLRQIAERIEYLRKLDERKQSVRQEIESQGKLTAELDSELSAAQSLQAVEDLYRPYKPKRHTRAALARQRGLEPLAAAIFGQAASLDPEGLSLGFLNQEVPDASAALSGARDIIAEQISDDASLRKVVRRGFAADGFVVSERSGEDADSEGHFKTYHDFRVALRSVQPHQWLALRRGAADGSLRVRIESPDSAIAGDLLARVITGPGSAAARQVQTAVEDGYDRLLRPSVDREIQADLGAYADNHAISVFSTNMRNLLLQPPVRGKVVMGIDPGFRTGCKVASVDPTGRLLHTATIYPHPPQREADAAKRALRRLIDTDSVTAIAIGNGTASRETESLIAELLTETPDARRHSLSDQGVAYAMVSEAGASVYSASDLARAEFPDLDVSMRGAVSIARRLQDPLAELVKIDTRSIGVGLYQHDVDQKQLTESLNAVVEWVVNYVGVNVNTASAALLSSVAGISKRVAEAIVAHRAANGPFLSRADLRRVKGLGPKAYEQAAGFLRVPEGAHPLDNTAVHPESYEAAETLLAYAETHLGAPDMVARLTTMQGSADLPTLAEMLGVGLPTLQDILEALTKPGRDPRDDLPPVVLRRDVLSIEDLRTGMRLQGTVRNVVDFGAFVDIGVKQDGLIHVSKMAKRFVRNPHEVVHVGDVVEVEVINIDLERSRIGLQMVE